MPYIQNTEDDVKAMLTAIGVRSIDDLFIDIPADVRLKDGLNVIPPSASEADVLRDLSALAAKNRETSRGPSFLGGGIERHFIPHVVDHISLDGNFITAYTPYQPEVSQGTLATVFQFQSMMSSLTGLPISNASLYDGASAVAEAVMVAYRFTTKKYRDGARKRVAVPCGLHPEQRATLATYARAAGFELVEIPFVPETGLVDRAALSRELAKGDIFCGLIPYPSFLGTIDDPTAIARELHDAGAIAVAVCHPLALSLLVSPGEAGCDIAVGEGQPLGCYQALGGPAFGFFSCSEEFLRFAPGRIVSETVDKEGKRAWCLALATREQHIRREKATSNICTNQALMALRAVIYLGSLGREGFTELGERMAGGARHAARALEKAGVKRRFERTPFFHEFVVEGPSDLLARGVNAGIQPGLDLGRYYDELRGCYLITVTETNTAEEVERLVALFR